LVTRTRPRGSNTRDELWKGERGRRRVGLVWRAFSDLFLAEEFRISHNLMGMSPVQDLMKATHKQTDEGAEVKEGTQGRRASSPD